MPANPISRITLQRQYLEPQVLRSAEANRRKSMGLEPVSDSPLHRPGGRHTASTSNAYIILVTYGRFGR
jgi:hypothetical protein